MKITLDVLKTKFNECPCTKDSFNFVSFSKEYLSFAVKHNDFSSACAFNLLCEAVDYSHFYDYGCPNTVREKGLRNE